MLRINFYFKTIFSTTIKFINSIFNFSANDNDEKQQNSRHQNLIPSRKVSVGDPCLFDSQISLSGRLKNHIGEKIGKIAHWEYEMIFLRKS